MKTFVSFTTIALALAGVVALGGSAYAAPKVCDDGTRPPCNKPSTGEAAANNLSYPAIFPEGIRPTGWVEITNWTFAPIADAGEGIPFGCVGENDIIPPETVDQNILCYYGRENLGLDEVTGLPMLTGDPKLWWLQQRTPNKWQAYNPVDPDTTTPVVVTAVDWGDLLESSANLNQKQVRTEMTLLFDASLDLDFVAGVISQADWTAGGGRLSPQDDTFQAFKMSGAVPGTDQSIAEVQGNDFGPGPGIGDFPGTQTMIDPRTVKSDTVTGTGFDATVYTRCARLIIQKVTGDPASLVWDTNTGHWEGSGVNNPVIDIAAYNNDAYSAEINAGGSLIYGYNWNTKTAAEGTGVYRLTYVIDGPSRCATSNTVFDETTFIANPGNLNFATLIPQGDAALNGGDEGGLTYIDVSVTVKGGGGKRK